MFSDDLQQYVGSLINRGIITTGYTLTISETNQIAKYIALIEDQEGNYEEKVIIIYKEKNDIHWSFISDIDEKEVNQKLEGWLYHNYVKRIVAPSSLIMDDTGIKMYGWFQINELPVVMKNNNVYLYCNQILPQHQSVVDAYQGIITIEDKP